MDELALLEFGYNSVNVAIAISAQKYVRRFLARTHYIKVRSGFTKLQAVIRGFLVRRHVTKMHTSASVIQQRYRGYKKTKAYREDFFQFKKAAKVIQNEWRRWKFRQGIE